MRRAMHPTRRSDRLDVDTVSGRTAVDLRTPRRVAFESFPFDVQLPRIEPGRIVLPGAEPGVAPWRLDAGVELPVRLGDVMLGRFVLVAATPTSGVAFPSARAQTPSASPNTCRAPVVAATCSPAPADLGAAPDPLGLESKLR